MEDKNEYPFSQKQWDNCIEVLQLLKDDPFNNPDNQLFGALVKKIYKKAKKTNRQEAYNERRKEDLNLSKTTVIVNNALKNQTVYTVNSEKQNPEYKQLNNQRTCYSCNKPYFKMHFHYHRLCPSCAKQSYAYRFKSIDLKGKNIILTGGRVKIGYATALRLLDSGANLTITTRFPALALEKFKEEKNYKDWKERLFIYGLDLRNIKAVHSFIEFYKQKHQTLDILINNAAQTIKYTNNYYQPLIGKEQQLLKLYKQSLQLTANETSVLEATPSLPLGTIRNEELQLNRFGQPVDERLKTSWNSRLEEISILELVEVNLINQIAPYILVKELTSLLKASVSPFKFIINVTSTEGMFSHLNKTIYHPLH